MSPQVTAAFEMPDAGVLREESVKDSGQQSQFCWSVLSLKHGPEYIRCQLWVTRND